MVSERGWSSLRSRPVLRRLALVGLLAGFGAIAYFLLTRSPVTADVEVRLDGEWPAVSSITLVYSGIQDDEPLREVRWFPEDRAAALSDAPRLVPGTYDVQVTVITTDGSRSFDRQLEHSRGGMSRIDLRF
jgi:hypothetical protein